MATQSDSSMEISISLGIGSETGLGNCLGNGSGNGLGIVQGLVYLLLCLHLDYIYIYLSSHDFKIHNKICKSYRLIQNDVITLCR